jgi:hypothetical protein
VWGDTSSAPYRHSRGVGAANPTPSERSVPVPAVEDCGHLGRDATGIPGDLVPAVDQAVAGGEFGSVVPPPIPEGHLGCVVKGPAVEPDGEWDTDHVIADVFSEGPSIHDDGLLTLRDGERVGHFDVAGVTLFQGRLHPISQ